MRQTMQTVIVIAVIFPVKALTAAAVLVVPWTLAACGADETSDAALPGDCPATPVSVVVSVDQWGDIVGDLGGSCATVTTVIAGSSVDPHDYEPSPADAAKFQGAQLVVMNGGHYDEWAAKLAETSAPEAPVVTALDNGQDDHGDDHDHDHSHDHDHGAGTNPHAWYSPAAVTTVADAVTAKLGELAPEAEDYFAERRAEFTDTMQPYDELIASIKENASGKTYAATEAVFDDMAAAVGLTDLTPAGYQVASSNEAEPSPADLDAFLRLLGDRGVDVLIYNIQTEGSVPEQIRAAAESAGVPVVEVTETVAPGADSFQAWQVDQLTALADALEIRP